MFVHEKQVTCPCSLEKTLVLGGVHSIFPSAQHKLQFYIITSKIGKAVQFTYLQGRIGVGAGVTQAAKPENSKHGVESDFRLDGSAPPAILHLHSRKMQ